MYAKRLRTISFQICRNRKKESWGKGQYTAVALFILMIAQVESSKFRSVYDTPATCKPGLFDCEDSNGCISASWVSLLL